MSSNAWQTSTGLVDEFRFDVQEAWFGTDEDYNEGKTLLFNLRGTATVDGEVLGEEGEHNERYSCGDGWVAMKGGQTAKHNGGTKFFNNRSKMGMLIDSVAENADVLEAVAAKGDPTVAATWAGFTFDMKRHTWSFIPRGGTEDEKITTSVMKVAGLAEDGDQSPGPVKAKATRKAKPKPKAKPKISDLEAALVVLAEDYDSHDDFVAAAFDEDTFERAGELEDDEELSDRVLDPDGGIWSE